MALRFVKVNLVVIILQLQLLRPSVLKFDPIIHENYYNVVKVTQNFEFYSAEDRYKQINLMLSL